MFKIYFVDNDDGLPPIDEQGVVVTDRHGQMVILPWWHTGVDHAICPLLFSRNNGCVWRPGIPLGVPQDDDASQRGDASSVARAEEELDWPNDPYENEDQNEAHPLMDQEDDADGEGEQFLLDNEDDFENAGQSERHCSRTQAFRYMMQIRPPPRHPGGINRNHWHDPHWLWWSRRLSEYYSIIYNNRVEREKHQWIKKKQEGLRSGLPQQMVEHLERQAERQLSNTCTYLTFYLFVLRTTWGQSPCEAWQNILCAINTTQKQRILQAALQRCKCHYP